MYERVGDELTVDDLARAAMYSKFHFTRIFRQVTGVPPGRFLATLRFQEAKWLLAVTNWSVAEISNRVGYSSLGTFSIRFKKFVGVTPTEYRRRSGKPGAWPAADRHSPPGDAGGPVGDGLPPRPAPGTVWGRVHAPLPGAGGLTFVGLFPDAVPEGSPIRSAILTEPGPYQLTDVPAGTWHLLAHGVLLEPAGNGRGAAWHAGTVGQAGPVIIREDAAPAPVDLRLAPMRTVDLPLLCAPFATRPRELGRGERLPVRVSAGHRPGRSNADGSVASTQGKLGDANQACSGGPWRRPGGAAMPVTPGRRVLVPVPAPVITGRSGEVAA
jgi:AraC-like DNA-binding protein